MKKNTKKSVYITVLLIVIALILSASIFLFSKSFGWFYTEQNKQKELEIEYTVAKLKFSLSSNHMYYYYSDDPEYDVFLIVINDLISAKKTFEANANETAKVTFDQTVQNLLKKVYPAEMINELTLLTITDYNRLATQIYDKYSNKIIYPFKITNIDFDTINSGYGIWYYFIDDVIQMYSSEYVEQKNASGVSSATIPINIKLKGGTTYSKDTSGKYYDANFSEMVIPITFKFSNEGRTSLFFSLKVNLEKNGEKGIVSMILPYEYNLKDITITTYPQYFTNGKLDYNILISTLLKSKYGSDPAYLGLNWTQLPFYTASNTDVDLADILNRWNEYALSTYSSVQNAFGNFELTDEQTVSLGMISFADYESVSSYYYRQTNKEYARDDKYFLNKCQISINMKTSLKNYNMNGEDFDTTKQYNEERNVEKFAAVSNFNVEGYAYFLQDNGNEVNAKLHMNGGYIICNYYDPSSENYICRFRFNVFYRGYSPALLRVRVIQQFTNTKNQIEGVNQIKFIKEPIWVDNRANDLYYYSPKLFYSTDKDILTTTGKAKLLSIPVIEGMKGSGVDIDPDMLRDNNTMTLKLSLYIEAVQPNRYEEYWNINQIPLVDANY